MSLYEFGLLWSYLYVSYPICIIFIRRCSFLAELVFSGMCLVCHFFVISELFCHAVVLIYSYVLSSLIKFSIIIKNHVYLKPFFLPKVRLKPILSFHPPTPSHGIFQSWCDFAQCVWTTCSHVELHTCTKRIVQFVYSMLSIMFPSLCRAPYMF